MPKNLNKTTDGVEENIVDLPRYAEAMTKYLAGSIERFAAKHPEAEVSCNGLYFTIYGKGFFINYDTQAHSDAWVKKYWGDKYARLGQDTSGQFSTTVNNNEYAQEDEYYFDGMPNFYEIKTPYKFCGLDGKVKKTNSTDENVGKVLIKTYEPVLKLFDQFGPLKRAKIFRMGICIHNTSIRNFWLHPPGDKAKNSFIT